MHEFLKDNCVDKKVVDKKPELGENKVIIGELYNEPRAEFTESYQAIIDKFQK